MEQRGASGRERDGEMGRGLRERWRRINRADRAAVRNMTPDGAFATVASLFETFPERDEVTEREDERVWEHWRRVMVRVLADREGERGRA